MKLTHVVPFVFAALGCALAARADQVWVFCPSVVSLGPGTNGSYYNWEEWHDGFQEYISHGNILGLTLLPAQTGTLRLQPVSATGILLMNVSMSDTCPATAGVGTMLPPLSSTQTDPGWTVTNNSTTPKTYWLTVWPWASGSYGYITYNIDVQITSPAIGASTCPGAPNSVGSGATLQANGSLSFGANNLTFSGALMPAGGFALLAGGSASTSPIPFGDGTLCIGGTIQRFTITPVSLAGTSSITLNLQNLPPGVSLGPGTEFFQLWYRDAVGPLGTGFNLTNGLALTFTP